MVEKIVRKCFGLFFPILTADFFFIDLSLYHTITTFNDPVKKPFENIVGKGENAGNQHFLLFPQCSLLKLKQISNQSKNLLFGK